MTSNTRLFDGIVIFNEVLKQGSFSAAAIATGHSTSYISKELNKLEERLGVRLLNRTTRTIGLTPEGQVFHQHCAQMINDTEQAVGIINLSNIKPKGVLKISCPVAFGIKHLKPILSKYLQQYPDVSLDVDFNDRHVDVIQDGFDLVIRATSQLEESSLICRKIYSCKSYTIASKEYLAKHPKPIEPIDLLKHKCICYSNLKFPNRWSYTDTKNTTIQVDVDSMLVSNNSTLQFEMTLAGHGICRLPEFCFDTNLIGNELDVVLDDYQMPLVDVFVVYPSRKHLSPKVRSFIDLLVDAI